MRVRVLIRMERARSRWVSHVLTRRCVLLLSHGVGTAARRSVVIGDGVLLIVTQHWLGVLFSIGGVRSVVRGTARRRLIISGNSR